MTTVTTVKQGALRIDIRRYADDRFGFDYKPPRGERKKVRCRQRQAAERRAKEMLATAKAGHIDMKSIDPVLFVEFLRWKETRAKVVLIPDLVGDFFTSKENKGLSVRHDEDLRGTLEPFAELFKGAVRDLKRDAVEAFLSSGEIGPRRWNNKLKHVVSLIKFARREGAISMEPHPVEHIVRRKTIPTKDTYTPKEFARMLATAESRDQIFLVLCGLCGLRPQEARPEAQNKPGVRWEHFDWRRNLIDLPAETSKTRERRFVPLCTAAIAFLSPKQGVGECIPHLGGQYIPKRVSKASGVPWKPDALRHSYASYKLALSKNMAALALEMGNSPTMIRQYYLNLKHDDQAELWFSVRPSNLAQFGTIRE